MGASPGSFWEASHRLSIGVLPSLKHPVQEPLPVGQAAEEPEQEEKGWGAVWNGLPSRGSQSLESRRAGPVGCNGWFGGHHHFNCAR